MRRKVWVEERKPHRIDEEHGEVGGISGDPLPGHTIGARCSPIERITGGEDLVGGGGGDEGNQSEKKTHVKK